MINLDTYFPDPPSEHFIQMKNRNHYAFSRHHILKVTLTKRGFDFKSLGKRYYFDAKIMKNTLNLCVYCNFFRSPYN